MPGETDLHKTLKKEACRWLCRMGYRCIAAEVRLPPLGIIDAVGTGIFRPYHNYLYSPLPVPQVCFIECKASRSDFLRDQDPDGQMHLWLMQRKRKRKPRSNRRVPLAACPPVRLPAVEHWQQSPGSTRSTAARAGKFRACILQPMANLHYILAPAGLIQKKDLAPRWGLLTYSEHGISVVVRADWQETSHPSYVESAIARTLTGDIYRADDRAMNSVNREIFAQQQSLANKIRAIRPQVVLAPPLDCPPPEEQPPEKPTVGIAYGAATHLRRPR